MRRGRRVGSCDVGCRAHRRRRPPLDDELERKREHHREPKLHRERRVVRAGRPLRLAHLLGAVGRVGGHVEAINVRPEGQWLPVDLLELPEERVLDDGLDVLVVDVAVHLGAAHRDEELAEGEHVHRPDREHRGDCRGRSGVSGVGLRRACAAPYPRRVPMRTIEAGSREEHREEAREVERLREAVQVT